jgi:acyl carrier protein
MSATQAALARIWSELLGVAQVGPDDSFFALGGHSLAATQLVTRIDTELGVRVPLAALFAVPTLAGLAGWVDEHRRERTSPDHAPTPFVVDLAGRHQPFALLPIPRAYWMGESEAFELGDIVAHVYHQFEIVSETPGEGTPDEGGPLARLQAVLDRLVARHEALRIVLDADGTQRVLADVPAFPLTVEDLRGCAPASVDARVHEVQARMQADGPSTRTWPLLEFHCQLLDTNVEWQTMSASTSTTSGRCSDRARA